MMPLFALLLAATTPVYVPPTTTTGTLGSVNAVVTTSVDGQGGAGLVIPASSTLVGILTPYYSCDNGTTFSPTSFVDVSGNSTATQTVSSGTALQIGVATLPCARQAQVKVTTYTSGTTTGTLVATQQAAIGSSVQGFGTAGTPSGGVVTVQPPSSGGTNFPVIGTTASNVAIGSLVQTAPAAMRTASPTYTVGNMGPPSMNAAGSQNVNIGDVGTIALVTAHNTTAAGNGVQDLPFIARSAVSAGTAGRSTAGVTDTTTGFQIVALGDGTAFNKAAVLANDTTAIANGLSVHSAVARASPTAVTAGRAEMQQVDTATGATFVESVATTSATGPVLENAFTVNTAANVKASAGNVYGISAANASASVCWLQFYNTAGTPTCGTSVVYAVALPVTPGVYNSPPMGMPIFSFTTGIGICVSTTPAGGTTCGSAASGTVLFK